MKYKIEGSWTHGYIFHGQLNCVADLLVLHCVKTPRGYEIRGRLNEIGIPEVC